MKLVTAEEMRAADAAAIEAGTSGECLMGRAARALAGEVSFYAEGHPRNLVVAAGPGNNGGDGYGLADHLHRAGWRVEVWSAIPREKVKGDALRYLNRAETSGVTVFWMPEVSDWEGAGLRLPPGTWLVDALLGTGVTEAPRGTIATAVGLLREAADRHRVFAVDVPSGLNPDAGTPFDSCLCVAADVTLTLGAAKRGFAEPAAIAWTGPVAVLDIGLEIAAPEEGSGEQVLTDREARAALPPPKSEDHKGSRGHALFIGGSPGMSGSISLAALSALRTGCGLSSVLAPFTTAPAVDASHKEIMVLPGKQGSFMTLSPQDIDFDPYRAVCMGPGLRVNPDTMEALRRVLQECSRTLVLDADALNVLARIGPGDGKDRRPIFLTPHPGEMARLLGKRVEEIQEDREAAVREAVARTHAHVVLKGPHSRMMNPDGSRWRNLNGNSALATAGTGDVLAGVLTGLLARGVSHDLALPLAVFAHGRAGELASLRKGIAGVVAGDVLEAIPDVMRHLQGR